DAPELRRGLSGVTDVAQVAQAQPSGDGRAALIPIVFDHRGSDLDQAVVAIEGHLKGTPAAGTGEAPINHDFNTNLLSGSSNPAVLSPTRIVTLLIVLVILALVYRAPLAVITP